MSLLTPEDLAAAVDVRQPADVVQRIAQEVSAITKVPVKVILGGSRAAPHCRAREIVMHAAHRMGLSTTEIGAVMSRDHTSIVRGLRNERRRRGEKN